MAATFAAHPDLAPTLRHRGEIAARNLEMMWDGTVRFAAREQERFLAHAPSRVAIAPPRPGELRAVAHAHLPAIAPHTVVPGTAPQFAARADDIITPDLGNVAPPAGEARALQAPAAVMAENERMASLRLKASLTPQMLQSFDLFLYVSKADKGPLAQRMYVFQKQKDESLKLAYDWAASTGRERSEINPLGHETVTDTPRGYYQLDPGRMYSRYHSHAWNQSMPWSMFFNWQHEGLATGLAIHGASGDDISRLGQRASAGCVHIAPENAQLLYRLVRANYKGEVPRFAYDRRTASTSNQGDFQQDTKGSPAMADGYKVLIFIEDYGGENVVAALF